MNSRSRIAFAVVMAVVSWPLPTVAAEDKARAGVEAATQKYAHLLVAGSPEDQAGMFTSDGELLEPGMAPISGRPAILEFFAPFAKKYKVESETMAADSVRIVDSSAFVWGSYRQAAGEIGQPAATYLGRYAAEWRLESDGAWRLRRLMVQPVGTGSR